MQLRGLPNRRPHPFVRSIQWSHLVATLLVLLLCFLVATRDARADVTVRGFVEYSHRSDLLTGRPFSNPPGREPTEDSITAGAEFSWPRWRIDVSHGLYARDCDYQHKSDAPDTAPCRWISGTRLTARRYFKLKKP